MALDVGRGNNLLLGHQVDVEFRARPDLEVRLEVQQALVHRDPPLAVMDRVGRIGVDERAAREHLALRLPGGLFGHLFRGDDVGEEDVGVDEDAERDAARQPEHEGDEKRDDVSAQPIAPGAARSAAASPARPSRTRAWPVVPWPAVFSLAGISSTRPFFTRLISRSSTPSSGGLRSSSAELIASSVGLDALQAGRRVVVARRIPLVQRRRSRRRRNGAFRRCVEQLRRPSRASAPPCTAPGCRRSCRCRRTPRRTARCAAACV